MEGLLFIADSSSKGNPLLSNGILTVTVNLLVPGDTTQKVRAAKTDSMDSIVKRSYVNELIFYFELSNNHVADIMLIPVITAALSDCG